MANIFRLKKGLNINLKGKAEKKKTKVQYSQEYGLVPDFFSGVTPKLMVKEGDHVLAGEALFVNKNCPQVGFASPVSGVVEAVVRGERRKVLCVKLKADEAQQYKDFGQADPALPYAVSTTPDVTPKGIFVSALRDMPLSGDFEYELQGNEEAFVKGLQALSKIAKVYLGVGSHQTADILTTVKDVGLNVFDGPCPAGNVGVQINHVSPVNKGETVWTVEPTAVIFFGRLFLTGKVNLTRTIAVAGSQVIDPSYSDVLVGTKLEDILKNRIVATEHIRILNGNPLTGCKDSLDGYLGAHTSEVTVIPEGDNVDEMLGWIMPRTDEFSTSRSYLSWLFKGRQYDLDARIKGGERHMIMSGEYDRVLPMDIYAEYLIKAIISGNIDRQEELGIYEVAPEDFALAEFVDSSKLPLQEIVRKGLDILRKENA